MKRIELKIFKAATDVPEVKEITDKEMILKMLQSPKNRQVGANYKEIKEAMKVMDIVEKAENELNWKPSMSYDSLVELMVKSDQEFFEKYHSY